MSIFLFVGFIVMLLIDLFQAQAVGITTPTPTFITSEYVIVDRIVTIFCLNTCGGECETCCTYGANPKLPSNYLTICEGRFNVERRICLELLSNLNFICSRSTYKYKTDHPAQEFELSPVFKTAKRSIETGIKTNGGIGIVTSSASSTGTSKKRAITHREHKFPYNYYDDSDLAAYLNTTVAFQEIFVCGSLTGALHYTPIVPSVSTSTPAPAFWLNSADDDDDDDHHHYRAHVEYKHTYGDGDGDRDDYDYDYEDGRVHGHHEAHQDRDGYGKKKDNESHRPQHHLVDDHQRGDDYDFDRQGSDDTDQQGYDNQRGIDYDGQGSDDQLRYDINHKQYHKQAHENTKGYDRDDNSEYENFW